MGSSEIKKTKGGVILHLVIELKKIKKSIFLLDLNSNIVYYLYIDKKIRRYKNERT